MSEDDKNPIDDKDSKVLDIEKDDPKATSKDDEKKKPSGEPSQKDLDWRQHLPEDRRLDKNIEKFKTLSDLVDGYNNLSSKMGKLSGALTKGAQDGTDLDKTKKLMEELFEQKDYDKDFDPDLGAALKKQAIPKPVAEAILKDYSTLNKESIESERSEKMRQYKDKLADLDKDGNLDRYLKVGLRKLDIPPSQYKKLFGDNAYNPDLVAKIMGLAKKDMSEKHIAINEGETGGLPSSVDELRSRLKNLSREKIAAYSRNDIREMNEIKAETEDIKVKLNAMLQKGRGSGTIL